MQIIKKKSVQKYFMEVGRGIDLLLIKREKKVVVSPVKTVIGNLKFFLAERTVWFAIPRVEVTDLVGEGERPNVSINTEDFFSSTLLMIQLAF